MNLHSRLFRNLAFYLEVECLYVKTPVLNLLLIHGTPALGYLLLMDLGNQIPYVLINPVSNMLLIPSGRELGLLPDP